MSLSVICSKCGNDRLLSDYRLPFRAIKSKSPVCVHCQREYERQMYKKRKENKRFTIPEGTIEKRCPHCSAVLWVYPDHSTGKCHKCQQNYTINKVLRDKKSGRAGGIILKKEIAPYHDYSGEILEYISSKKATYITEIRRELSIGRRIVENTISTFEKEGVVRIVPGKNANWVMVC